MYKINLAIIFTWFSLICCLPACDYDYQFSEVKVKEQYVISFPDYMEEEKTGKLSTEASLTYVNFFRNIYAIVLDKPKITESPKAMAQTPETIAQTAKTDLLRTLNNPRGVSEGALTINGLAAYQFELEGDVGDEGLNERIFYKVTVIEGEKHHYQVVLWTWDKWQEKYEKTLDEIVHSFKEL